jgi:hypothetical protein
MSSEYQQTQTFCHSDPLIEAVYCRTPFEIKRRSELMQFPYRVAVKFRLMYLRQQLEDWADWMMNPQAWLCNIPYGNVKIIVDEMRVLRNSLIVKEEKERITDEEIEIAKQYPITKLITFVGGKCKCPFHDDKSPSMFHGTRNNIAHCPVCAKGYGPIKLLVERDKMTFFKAVKYLCSIS